MTMQTKNFHHPFLLHTSQSCMYRPTRRLAAILRTPVQPAYPLRYIMSAPRPQSRPRTRKPQAKGPQRQVHLASSDPTPAPSGTVTPAIEGGSGVRFRDFSGLSEAVLSGIPFEFCTEVSLYKAKLTRYKPLPYLQF
jgi:hypothetical protein